uniref:uncharacterized protein LOC120346353 isoform X1 n=1 Tax=Styela clava TaxID=7725 RepID=UPI00193A4523|nr:uncharacterized protein LOC120346353 isoform X1 [Styela clava]
MVKRQMSETETESNLPDLDTDANVESAGSFDVEEEEKHDESHSKIKDVDSGERTSKLAFAIPVLIVLVIGLAIGWTITSLNKDQYSKDQTNYIEKLNAIIEDQKLMMANQKNESQTAMEKVEVFSKKLNSIVSGYTLGKWIADDEVIFWIVKLRASIMTFTGAEDFCIQHGSTLPIMRNEEEFDAINKMIRNGLPQYGRVSFWTGLTYDITTNTIVKDGSFTQWENGYPSKSPYSENVFINVAKDPNESYQGMRNWQYSIPLNAVLCQI